RVGALYIIAASIGAGLTLLRNPEVLAIRKLNTSVSVLLGCIWALLASATLMTGAWLSGASYLSLLRPPFPIKIRSVTDVVLIGCVLALLALGLSRLRPRKDVIGAIWLGVLAVLIHGVCGPLKAPAREYLALWAEHAPALSRFFFMFDLGNDLWLGVVLPFCVIREFLTDDIQEFSNGSLLDPGGVRPVLLLLLAPASVGFLLELVLTKGFHFLDVLSLGWYVKKSCALLLWTATFEEIIYRVTCLAILKRSFSSL